MNFENVAFKINYKWAIHFYVINGTITETWWLIYPNLNNIRECKISKKSFQLVLKHSMRTGRWKNRRDGQTDTSRIRFSQVFECSSWGKSGWKFLFAVYRPGICNSNFCTFKKLLTFLTQRDGFMQMICMFMIQCITTRHRATMIYYLPLSERILSADFQLTPLVSLYFIRLD
jgi:hypothetical protein